MRALHNRVPLYSRIDGELVSHFSLHEFQNKAGVVCTHPALLEALEFVHRDLRALYAPRRILMIITDGIRTDEDLEALASRLGWITEGGLVAKDSTHLVKNSGCGTDVKCLVQGEDGISIKIPRAVTGPIFRKYFDFVKDDYQDGHTHADVRNRAK